MTQLEGELIADLRTLRALAPEWDALAVDNGLPLMAPAWVLAWWDHVAPDGAEPRAVAVRDGDRLVGLAPLYVERGGGRVDFRLPGIALGARLAPLARSDREWDVAAAVARTLAATGAPDLLALEGVPVASHWPVALRDGWPGSMRPLLRRYHVHGAPVLHLGHASFEAWMGSRSSNFRAQMRRLRRRFAADGGAIREATAATLDDDVDTLLRLHAARWESLGASNLVALGARMNAMLGAVGGESLASGRFRLVLLEIGGEPIAAQLFLAAGGEVLYFNSGWDERHAELKPTMLGLLHAIEDAYRRGDRRLDLGLGEQAYKLRFADGNDPVAWSVVLPAGPRLPFTWARTAPMLGRARLRDAAKRALTEQQVERLRGLVRRPGA
jgi:CelD/BcsL family acetyltransferase involved in cellulose biosynthesis